MKTRSFLTLLSICALCFGASAQASAYGFSAQSGAFTAITGGTVISTTIPDTYISPNFTFSPGFNFSGVTYTNAYVSSNGFITLGGTIVPGGGTTNNILTTNGSGISLCPFNADLIGSTATGATPNIRFETVGNEHVFQWLDASRYPATTDRFSFQARLNVITKTITFVYDFTSAGTSVLYQPVVGIRTSPTDFKNLSVTSAGPETWANPNIGLTNADVLRFTTTAPAKVITAGQTYIFSPPSCMTPALANFTTSSISYSAATLTWTPGNNESLWIFGYAPPTTTLAVSSPSYLLNNLTPSTTYTVRVRAYCGVGDSSAYITRIINTPCQPPVITSITGGSICVTGTLNLQATTASSATISWYTSLNAASPTATNSTFTTPTLTNTTTYYATTTGGLTLGSVGAISPTQEGGSISASNVDYEMNFDVLSPTTIQSVDVFPTAAVGSAASIKITTSAGVLISEVQYTTTVTGGAMQTVALGIPVPAGTGFKMRQGVLINLNRNTTNAVYPYTSSAINITGNGFSAVYFYYFYNWKFSVGCESPRTPVTVTVNPRPNILALSSATGAVCAGSPVNLLCGGNATNYTWTPSGGSASLATVAPNMNTTYTVAAELAGHCATTATVAVAVTPKPLVSINTANTTLCSGESAQLTASGNAINYVWYPDGGINPTAVVSPTATTIYVATGYNALGCAGTSSIQIDINESPSLQVTASKTLVCQREGVTLYASTDATSFVWSNSSTSLSTNVVPLSTTTYSISASNGVCTSVASIQITTDACTAIEKQDAGAGISLYPNPANDAFTVAMPSGNDKASLQVFDVTGKLVVAQALTQELNTVNITSLQPGVYFFKVSNNTNELKTGKIVKQ